MEKTISKIAKEVLGLPTLKTRNSDRLDFPEICIWQLKKALEEAYVAGVGRGATGMMKALDLKKNLKIKKK